MSTASFLPAASRARGRLSIRRMAAWLAACASAPKAAPRLVIGFAAAHAVLWTLILVNLKAAQDVHMDVAEAFAWGQKFQFGYGKHPPLAGWVAGVWFRIFPVANWATYALAMATLGCGLVICWLIALRVVDRRRAFFVVVMLALYPVFNFKGFKYNPDLLQLVTLPLLVLAYLHAFEKRNLRAGLWLGLAGALALMTKYWVLTMIGAVGLAALIHPDRWLFLRSPAPWVAIATLVVAMIPHLVWLKEVDFVPLTYAGDVYGLSSRAQNIQLVLGYIAQYLDHPDRGRDRPSARRPDFHGLHEDRSGNFAVLPDPAGAGCDSMVAPAKNCAVSYDRDLAPRHARSACRLALHRRPGDGGESERRRDLRRAFRSCSRIDPSLAYAFQFTMGRSRRHHGGRRAHDILQSGSSGALHAGRDLVVGADLARAGQAARLHRHLRYDGRAAAGLRRLDGGQWSKCRASLHHHAAFLSRASGSRDQLEGLYRAAREIRGSYLSPQGRGVGAHQRCRYVNAPISVDHVPSSLNLLATSSVIASMAALASGPTAETTMDVPGAADSIINPMIEVPPTVSPPRVTQTSALKRSTI